MHFHRLSWVQVGMIILLALALPACERSASTSLTPLPSLPPSTPLFVETTVTVTASATVAVVSGSGSEEPLLTESPVAATTEPAATKDASASPSSCESDLPTRLRLNSYAYVNPDPPLPNNLRSEAGSDNALIGEAQPGQALQILEGPQCVDGSTWWKVRPLDTDLEGWTAEGDDQDYWLIPCASSEACGTE